MKGLLKYLSPFAPDTSGAVSVLYELGGILVICDAGGCTGNICGFDEPRFFSESGGNKKKSMIFSAGLRDMDAILGRDRQLVEKIAKAAGRLDAGFVALIGTPVPAVIATDFHALKRMTEKATGLPVLIVESTGTGLYDAGAEAAYLALFRAFAQKEAAPIKGTLGVLGATPLDVGDLTPEKLRARIQAESGADGVEPENQEIRTVGEGAEKTGTVYCYGMGAGLDQVALAGCAEKNLVIAPAGLAAAKYLEKAFGTPYEVAYPLVENRVLQQVKNMLDQWKKTKKDLAAEEKSEPWSGKASPRRILIIHQQVAANAMRKWLRGVCLDQENSKPEIICGTWFHQEKSWCEPGDVAFLREDEFVRYVLQGDFDLIVADGRLLRALGGYEGAFIPWAHYAISGEGR